MLYRIALIIMLITPNFAWAACTITVGKNTAYPNLQLIAWPNVGTPSTVCINPGIYTEALAVQGVSKTAGNIVTVQPTDPQNLPDLRGGVVIRNSSYVVAAQLNVSNANGHAAVVLDQGTHHATVDRVRAHDSQFGVAIGTAVMNGMGGPAGAGNSIQNSAIESNKLNGIAVSHGSGGSASPNAFGTFITNNRISNNGGSGVDVDSSRQVKIESNRIDSNGFNDGGRSGIHLFASTDDATCGGHLIRYNFVSNTKTKTADISGTDGNGIHIDSYCDNNTIAFNVIWNNAGPGVAIFTAAHNQVYANSIGFNLKQSNRAIDFKPADSPTGELTIAGCNAVNPILGHSDCADKIVRVGRTHDNYIFDNVVHSAVYGVPGINVVSSASSPTLHNTVGPNMIWVSNAAFSGPSANWAPLFYGGASTAISNASINAMTGTSGNLIEYPWSLSEGAPKSTLDGGSDGFKLTKKPSGNGYKLPLDLTDMLGRRPSAGSSNFGAYYCTPATGSSDCTP